MNIHARLKKKQGFTLIELLVVISIIGLLASVVLVAVNKTRMKARNARRVADIRNIVNALELYYNDNGYYPISPGGSWAWYGWATCWPPEASGPDWISGLSPKYIAKMPRDPESTENCSDPQYLYASFDGKNYKLLAHVGGNHSADCQYVVALYPSLRDPARDCWAYGFYTPGAKDW